MRKFQRLLFVEAIMYLLLCNLHNCTFNFSFKKESEMEDGRDQPLQFISVKFILNIHG